MWLGRLILITSLLYFNPVFSQFKSNEQVQLNLKNQTFVAKVIGISDGDTMEILYHNAPIKITSCTYRLSGKKRRTALWK